MTENALRTVEDRIREEIAARCEADPRRVAENLPADPEFRALCLERDAAWCS